MASGARKNYKFGQKNNWRRTVWNEVLRRTNGREKAEPILYLAGPQDIDRAIAVDKGVPEQNLIAIDRDIANVASVRKEKQPALHGDLREILASWPESRPVCAVLIDFCCGLTMDAIDVYDLLERKPFRNAVVMVNMMRGRDAWSNEMREQIAGGAEDYFDMLMAVSTWEYGPQGPPGAECLNEKHRALIWLVYHAIDWWATASRYAAKHVAGFPGYEEGYEDAAGIMMAGRYFKTADPHFYSYRSGALCFDSVVFQYPLGVLFARPRFQSGEGRAALEEVEAEIADNPTFMAARSQEMARKISAMLAVRTSRLAS